VFDRTLPFPRNLRVRVGPTGGGRERFGTAVKLAVLAEFGFDAAEIAALCAAGATL
jgi:hypothetical protein